MCSPQPAKDFPPEAQIQPQWMQDSQLLSETQPLTPEQSMFYSEQAPLGPDLLPHLQLPLSTQLHAQPYLPLPQPRPQSENNSQTTPPLTESQPQKKPFEPDSALTTVPQVRLARQTTGEVGIMEEENEEEEDMQGWVCLPGMADKSFNLAEGSFDLGDGSLDSFADNNESLTSFPPEETHPVLERHSLGMNKDILELSDNQVENVEEKQQLEDDISGLKELKERISGMGEGNFEAETMNVGLEKGSLTSDERSEVLGNDSATKGDIAEQNNDSLDVGNHGGENTKGLKQTDREAGFEAGKNSKQHEDFNPNMERSVAENEGKRTSCVSLQVSVVWFYHHRHHHRPGSCTLSTHLLMWLHLLIVFSPSLHCCCCCFVESLTAAASALSLGSLCCCHVGKMKWEYRGGGGWTLSI